MGYYSSAEHILIEPLQFINPISVAEFNTYVNDDCWDDVEFFLGAQFNTDECGNIVGIYFSYDKDSGKAYSLDASLEALQKGLVNLNAGVALTGSFLLAGEDFDDVTKYVLTSDGKVTKHKGVITFPTENA